MKENNYMDRVTQGVYILGVKEEEKVNFMTAAWLTRISSKPNTILVAVGNTHYTAEMIRRIGSFSVNVLGEGQESLARRCGFVSGRTMDKSKGMNYELVDGMPVICDTSAYLLCRVTGQIEEGDHTLFIGVVENGEKYEKAPLIYDEKTYF